MIQTDRTKSVRSLSRRQFLWGLAATTSSLAIAACAAPVAPGAAPATSGSEAAAGTAAEPITITMHIQAGWEEAVPGMYVRRPEKFMEENPDIKIEMVPIPGAEYDTKLLTLASSGTIADTMHTSDVWTQHTRMAKLGVLRNVDEHLEAGGISKDEWLPAAVDTLTLDGKMYGLPKTCHPGDAYIWINEDLFNAAGIALPETYGTTFEQISEWSTALTQGPEDDRQVYGFVPRVVGIQGIVNGVRQHGTYENNEEGTESLANNEQWMQWASWINSFYERNEAATDNALPSGGADALFLAGRIAMRPNQRFFYRRVNVGMEEVEQPFSWRVIQYPRGPEAIGWGASVDTHSVSTNCQHPDEAFRVIYAMADSTLTRYVAEDQGYLTARVDDLETVEDMIYPFLELQYQCMTEEAAFRQPANARGLEVETIYKNELDKIWLAQEPLTPAFMENVKSAVDEVLNKPF
ncbi:MAG: extracellular solute-binding protein [Caldilineaceae bacterium]|nr:extracellular solute-binding protein [Caldilineaceae bacterium]